MHGFCESSLQYGDCKKGGNGEYPRSDRAQA